MTNANDPIDTWYNADNDELITGLTKREYFAAMAMSGILVNNAVQQNIVSAQAVTYADALINELNKQP